MNDKDKAAVITGGLAIAGLPFALAGITAFFIALGAWTDYVAYKLWEWFVVPAFNAPHLTWFQVFCITLIVSLYTPKRYVKGEKHDTSGLMIGIIVIPALILLVGYIAHHYMQP